MSKYKGVYDVMNERIQGSNESMTGIRRTKRDGKGYRLYLVRISPIGGRFMTFDWTYHQCNGL